MTSLIGMGKMMYSYGRDRKELNGTVDRVKRIENTLDQHIREENEDHQKMRRDITTIKTTVELLVDHDIKRKD